MAIAALGFGPRARCGMERPCTAHLIRLEHPSMVRIQMSTILSPSNTWESRTQETDKPKGHPCDTLFTAALTWPPQTVHGKDPAGGRPAQGMGLGMCQVFCTRHEGLSRASYSVFYLTGTAKESPPGRPHDGPSPLPNPSTTDRHPLDLKVGGRSRQELLFPFFCSDVSLLLGAEQKLTAGLCEGR